MATKPIKFLELHYTMTQFLITTDILIEASKKKKERNINIYIRKRKEKEKYSIDHHIHQQGSPLKQHWSTNILG